MSFNIRSNHGCWTCRLRKKKCDETNPACSVCESLSLSCHGYGPKPEWMDGGSKERKTAANIQHMVKQASSQKRQDRMRQMQQRRRSSSRIRGTPNSVMLHVSSVPMCGLVQEHNNNNGHVNSLNTGLAPLVSGRLRSLQHLAVTMSKPRSHLHRRSRSRDPEIEAVRTEAPSKLSDLIPAEREEVASIHIPVEDEESLFMHYLDHVFPLQFRFYTPSICDGGRGWLFSILIRTKPLYHAALTLAAYHKQATSCPARAKTESCTLDELLRHHVLAVRELRHYLDGFGIAGRDKSLPEVIEVLSSMALLTCLEVSSFLEITTLKAFMF